MNKSDLVNVFTNLSLFNEPDPESNISEVFSAKYEEICNKLKCTYEDISLHLNSIVKYYFSDPNIPEWKYLILNLYILSKIGDMVENSNNTELLSVKEIKNIKTSVAHLTKLGIYTKLQPRLPFYVNKKYTKTEDIFFQYNILKCSVLAFCEFLNNADLRILLLTDNLRAILMGLYQIAYCPLYKNINSTFTVEIYTRLLEEKQMAVTLINKLRESIHPMIYIKETMIIFRHNSPVWFIKTVSLTLTNIMVSQNGVKNISIAMLDGIENDKTRTWKALDIILRLILSCRERPDFKTNVCQQVVKLVDEADDSSVILERLFVICTKNFYLKDKDISLDIFVRKVITELLQFTYKNTNIKEGDITDRISKNVRLVHAIFIENTVGSPIIPTEILKPILGVLFRLYTLTLDTIFKERNNDLKEILIKFLIDHPEEDSIVFDSFLFDINGPYQILPFRKDISLHLQDKNVMLKFSEHSEIMSTSDSSEGLMKLLKNNTEMLTRFFGYLLRCLANTDKYFKKASEELLSSETEIMNEYIEKKLVTYKLLSTLAEDKNVQKQVVEYPEDFISFVRNVVERTIKTNMHKTTEQEGDGFQMIFTVMMILHAIVTSSSKINSETFKILEEPLTTIKNETKYVELADLVHKILSNIEVSDKKPQRMNIEETETKSELDVIFEDIYDPLLPVRGHGVMALKKLVQKRDPQVMEKKQYILTVFQETLKNEDSYIYLSAIDGLAAMADILPDTVISTLCDEYSDFTRQNYDGHEVRIKLGEVLVRVTKMLGEMAPKYKALLLNTFLAGTKVEDHLVRASSLSNLGEICRVLSYKLGAITTEVLVCVHDIITTDKAVEARRAAVTVIRQLLTGLESEMISFLKEDILHIYGTLKYIYHNDKDDVMRLQAQLALEELNENMKTFVFPKPRINTEKKIIMLS